MTTPQAAIIVPHYNDGARLAKCLAALEASAGFPRTECVVVDNGSTEDLAPLAARHPAIRFVTEATRGAGAARNRGVAETTAPWLFFIDCDCLPSPEWIGAGLAAMASGRADVYGGPVELFDETPPPRSGAQAYETVFAFNFKDYIERKQFTGSGNMITSRAVFETVGGFRGAVAEDMDWSRRAIAAGFSIRYEPTLRVGHPTRADLPGLIRKALRTEREMFLLASERPMGRLRWGLRALLVLCSPALHAWRVLRHPRLDSPAERLRGVGVLIRLRVLRAGLMAGYALGVLR